MEREKKDLTTPNGLKLELIKSLTVGERNKIRGLMVSKSLVGADGQLDTGNMNSQDLDLLEQTLIGICVLSYDGVKEKIYENFINSTEISEYDFVIQSCVELMNPNLEEAK